jgi:hypothetical protein
MKTKLALAVSLLALLAVASGFVGQSQASLLRGGRAPGLARGSTSAAKARPLARLDIPSNQAL